MDSYMDIFVPIIIFVAVCFVIGGVVLIYLYSTDRVVDGERMGTADKLIGGIMLAGMGGTCLGGMLVAIRR